MPDLQCSRCEAVFQEEDADAHVCPVVGIGGPAASPPDVVEVCPECDARESLDEITYQRLNAATKDILTKVSHHLGRIQMALRQFEAEGYYYKREDDRAAMLGKLRGMVESNSIMATEWLEQLFAADDRLALAEEKSDG